MNSNVPMNLSDKTTKNEKKKRSSQNKSVPRENPSKTTQKENQDTKKTIIDWEEEKEILKQFLNQEYPLTLSSRKIDRIIEEKQEKYLDMDKYKSFFLKNQAKLLNKKIKLSNKISNAPKDTKQFFDLEAKEDNSGNFGNEDEEIDDEDTDYTDKSNSDDKEDDDIEEDDDNIITNPRKRKCEFSTLEDEHDLKKKDSPTLRWLPNGNKV